jgi:hypothetical protein
MTTTLPSSSEQIAAACLAAPFAFGCGRDRCGLGQLARLDASDHPFSASALLARHFARDISVEVDTGAASREAFLVRQTVDVSLQCGIDLSCAEHAIDAYLPRRDERNRCVLSIASAAAAAS